MASQRVSILLRRKKPFRWGSDPRRQEAQLGARLSTASWTPATRWAGQVVQHHDVTGPECGDQQPIRPRSGRLGPWGRPAPWAPSSRPPAGLPNVVVCQCAGPVPGSVPRAGRALTAVPSWSTSRSHRRRPAVAGSRSGWPARHACRRRATSGRSCSQACAVFFLNVMARRAKNRHTVLRLTWRPR